MPKIKASDINPDYTIVVMKANVSNVFLKFSCEHPHCAVAAAKEVDWWCVRRILTDGPPTCPDCGDEMTVDDFCEVTI